MKRTRTALSRPHRRPLVLSRRLALVSVAALGLAACGTDGDSLPVIRLGGGVDLAAGATEDASRMSMIAWYDYELGAELPALDDPAEAWVLRSSADADAVGDLARSLGVEGDVTPLPADQGGGWRVGADDGTAPSLWVSSDGAATWSLSGAWADDRAGWSCSSEGDMAGAGESSTPVEPDPTMPVEESPAIDPPDDRPEVVCSEPAPPRNVPSASAAESLFTQMLGDLGVSTEGLTIESSADTWGAWVNATHRVDGMMTPLYWSASYGEDAELTYASGYLGEPVSIGDVPRVGTAEAFERLASGEGGWWNVMPLSRSSDAVMMSDTVVSSEPAVDIPDIAGDVMPPESEPATPITVTIVDVDESLWSVWDVDGTTWLLPAYDFVDSDGGRHTVPAIPDEMIEQDTDPIDTVPNEDTIPTDDTNVGPPPDTAVVPTTFPEQPMDTTPPVSDPDFPGGLGALIGLPEDEAAQMIAAAGFSERIVSRDGEDFAVTMDYRSDRVNLGIVDGVVTTATIG
jgi:hypothetical protein